MSNDHISCPVDPSEIEDNHLMAFTYWTTVKKAKILGRPNRVNLIDVDGGQDFFVEGKALLETSKSADQFQQTVTCGKAEIAERLIQAKNVPFTVEFTKQDGSPRKLRGRLIKPEAIMGRSYVEDLDLDASENRLRQVDHRTIQSLIVDGVKYVH